MGSTRDPDYDALTKRGLAEVAEAHTRDEANTTKESQAAPTPTPSSQEKARKFRELGSATYLSGAMHPLLGNTLDLMTCQAYLEEFVRDAGDPQDPIARLLVEQLATAHQLIGRYHIRAATTTNLEEAKVYLAAAARLLGEFRRSSLALEKLLQAAEARQTKATKKKRKLHRPRPGAATSAKQQCNTQLGSKNRISEYMDDLEPVLS